MARQSAFDLRGRDSDVGSLKLWSLALLVLAERYGLSFCHNCELRKMQSER